MMFNKTIEVKYTRIKKPKKDEIILFTFPEGVDCHTIELFYSEIKRASKCKSGGYLVLAGKLETHYIKKNQVKTKNEKTNSRTK